MPDDLAAVAVAYVQFAPQRPALFRVMFGESCDPNSSERVDAVTAMSEYVGAIVRPCYPAADPDALSTAVWALVHGLAFLHLDGKLDSSTRPSSRTGCAPPSTPCTQRPTPRNRRWPVRRRTNPLRAQRARREYCVLSITGGCTVANRSA
jgi:hypothetical protein